MQQKGFCSCRYQIHELIPELYANQFDISEFPHLSNYYSQAIGLLPNQEFLRNVLDLVFQKFLHLQTIQEYLYSVIKHFLVGLKHPDWMQFHFISDNIVDPMKTEEHILETHNEHLADDQDCLHDKTHDFNCTYITTDSQFLEQQLLQKQAVYRTVSCPDLEQGLKYIPQSGFNNTTLQNTPPDSDKEIQGTKTNKGPRASTPIETDKEGTKLSKKVMLQAFLYHPGALHILASDIIAAPGLQGPIHNYLTHAAQRLQNMAQQVPAGLQGADPTLIEILNRVGKQI